jgi:hypothetical protein
MQAQDAPTLGCLPNSPQAPAIVKCKRPNRGGMCERLKQAVLKTAVPERVPGVRIPLPPPCSLYILECVVYINNIARIWPAIPQSLEQTENHSLQQFRRVGPVFSETRSEGPFSSHGGLRFDVSLGRASELSNTYRHLNQTSRSIVFPPPGNAHAKPEVSRFFPICELDGTCAPR